MAVLYAIDHPEATAEELSEFVRGPDFPTGAYIVGNKGIKDALLTGKGSIRMRSVTDVVEMPRKRLAIVVSEIPYQVSRDRIMKKVADAVRDKRITGISDLRDESDRDGTRLVVELKKDANPQVILNQLFKHTQLEESFSVNAVALVDGVPKTLNLAELVHHYVAHQLEVIERRSRFRLERARDRSPHRRGASHRSRQHRRGRQDHPGLGGRGRGEGDAARALRPLGDPGQPHPRYAASAAHRARDREASRRVRRAAGDDRALGGDPRFRRAAEEGRRRRAE